MQRRLSAILAGDIAGYSQLMGVAMRPVPIQIEESKAAARKGIKPAERELILHPEDPRPAHLGAGALLELGKVDRAREWIARALAIDPDQRFGACQLGETRFRSGWSPKSSAVSENTRTDRMRKDEERL